ncbi:MAG TPA: ubiquitin-conjugating enzyme E2, partial [Planctomycetota bacterium]|nr:ubiquitin-conjugating enzyme E2 [Planctomycetota bacterium]
MNVRQKRLQADHEKIKEGLRNHPAIRIRGVSGSPPERYQIDYAVRSLSENTEGKAVERNEHTVEVYLTLAYPRQAPQCRMLTPVFHPNIAPHAICIGDHWAAGESLLNLILRIGEMLAFQSYNLKSPLNGSAARWVEENQQMLPTDARDLSPQSWINTLPEAAGREQCRNCHAADKPLRECSQGHTVCADCTIACARCGGTFCLMCKLETCSVCSRLVCKQCCSSCKQCGRTVCNSHVDTCETCGQTGCSDCVIACTVCGKKACTRHIRQCTVCRAALCIQHALLCPGCGKYACSEHSTACSVCGRFSCPDCSAGCDQCGAALCLEHLSLCSVCKRVVCSNHRLVCPQCNRSFCKGHFDSASNMCFECRRRPAGGDG